MRLFCRAELLPPLLRLLKDLEAEVRIAAASKVPSFSRVLSVDQVAFNRNRSPQHDVNLTHMQPVIQCISKF